MGSGLLNKITKSGYRSGGMPLNTKPVKLNHVAEMNFPVLGSWGLRSLPIPSPRRKVCNVFTVHLSELLIKVNLST